MTPSPKFTAYYSTVEHIEKVREHLRQFEHKLRVRGVDHDHSKFQADEMQPLQRMQDLIAAEGPADYGTEEYKRRSALLGDMTKLHYARNSHHPEHYKNGVSGMGLLDLVEMYCDWKAASLRGKDPTMNLSHSFARFGFSEQLASIFINTAAREGVAFK